MAMARDQLVAIMASIIYANKEYPPGPTVTDSARMRWAVRDACEILTEVAAEEASFNTPLNRKHFNTPLDRK